MGFNGIYPLVNVYILLWKDPPVLMGKWPLFRLGHVQLLCECSPEGNKTNKTIVKLPIVTYSYLYSYTIVIYSQFKRFIPSRGPTVQPPEKKTRCTLWRVIDTYGTNHWCWYHEDWVSDSRDSTEVKFKSFSPWNWWKFYAFKGFEIWRVMKA